MQNSHYGSGPQNNNNGAGVQHIHTIVHNFNPSEPNALRMLLGAISGIGATHDAEQQCERGECLPKTREKAIKRILNWVMSPGEHPILWLTGAAGVGKTAIAITVAKTCEENGRLVTSFFFFRADERRNNPSALILFIAYGLTTTISLVRTPIEERISRDPRILEARMEDQFRELVVKPLAHQQASPSPKPVGSSSRQSKSKRMRTTQTRDPYLVIIDGLDECSDEKTQRRILSTIQSAYNQSTSFPLRFLIVSRPESWLREAFNMPSLQPLHQCIVLDESFEPTNDIIRYYSHHFEEIRADPQYSQVKFPSPWPSKADFDTLVERTDGQFAYAATAIRFIKQPFSQPIEQLEVILKYTSPRRPGALPFEQLDALYHFILGFNPHQEEVVSILAAILVVTNGRRRGEVTKCPACIELILGLPSGQVALTLRGMYSVLNIRGSGDEIHVFHNSFREYLEDPKRSGSFHIHVPTWKRVIMRKWLQNLSAMRIKGYSFNQLWDLDTQPFYTRWRQFCTSGPVPTRDLLDDLQHVDLVSPYWRRFHSIKDWRWEEDFKELVTWVRKYKGDVKRTKKKSDKKSGDCTKTGKTPRLNANGYLSPDNGQCDVSVPGREMDKGRDGLDHVEVLVHRFENRPHCFHLEWPSGVLPPPPADVLYWIINRVVPQPWVTWLKMTQPSADNDVRLTDCRCDLSGGNESRDPSHLAYQEACLKVVKALISLFEELSQSGAKDVNAILKLEGIFLNLTQSSLLQHCSLDMELVLLCRSFFGLAKDRPIMWAGNYTWEDKVKENMLKWFETFPVRLAAEGEALKTQFLCLPWEQWDKNRYSY